LRTLITGVTGFAGSHLADHFLDTTDCEVYGVARKANGHIAHLRGRLRFIAGDVLDADSVIRILRQVRPRWIFHLAGQPYVPAWQELSWPTLELNIRGQLNVLEAVARLGLDARVLVVGSAEEYGRVQPSELPIKETTPLRPENPYGVSKVAQDLLGLQYFLSHNLDTVRVRPFNHIGPRQSERFVAPAFAKQIAEIEAGRKAPILHVGNLNAQRDFTDVRDVARAYHLALEKGQSGEVYNIGTGVAHSVQTLLDILLGLTPVEIRVEQDPARLRLSDVPVKVCDATKFRAQTGWAPRVPIEQTLRDVLEEWRARVKSQREEKAHA